MDSLDVLVIDIVKRLENFNKALESVELPDQAIKANLQPKYNSGV